MAVWSPFARRHCFFRFPIYFSNHATIWAWLSTYSVLNVISTSSRVTMKFQRVNPIKVSASFAVGAASALALAACGGGSGGGGGTSQVVQQMSSGFADTALVSNKTGVVA